MFTWELGGALGHLGNILPLARGLCDAGHRVYLALRDLSQARSVFAGLDVALLQALTALAAKCVR
jgi:UDP:flavonoid glycosyltransferase YjiC (YdhE family)